MAAPAPVPAPAPAPVPAPAPAVAAGVPRQAAATHTHSHSQSGSVQHAGSTSESVTSSKPSTTTPPTATTTDSVSLSAVAATGQAVAQEADQSTILEEKKRNEERRKLVTEQFGIQYRRALKEQEKLARIKQELSKLDVELMANIDVLRREIEKETRILSDAKSRFRTAEKEFLESRSALEKSETRKRLLTEHLDLIILTNEKEKALKLEQLMDKLGVHDVPSNLRIASPYDQQSTQEQQQQHAAAVVAATQNPTTTGSHNTKTTNATTPVISRPMDQGAKLAAEKAAREAEARLQANVFTTSATVGKPTQQQSSTTVARSSQPMVERKAAAQRKRQPPARQQQSVKSAATTDAGWDDSLASLADIVPQASSVSNSTVSLSKSKHTKPGPGRYGQAARSIVRKTQRNVRRQEQRKAPRPPASNVDQSGTFVGFSTSDIQNFDDDESLI
jgi:hypothetical protein